LPAFGMMLGVLLDLLLQTTGRRIPCMAAAVLAAYALAVLVRDGRRRLYYVMALAAGVAGTLMTASAPAAPLSPLGFLPPAGARAGVPARLYVGGPVSGDLRPSRSSVARHDADAAAAVSRAAGWPPWRGRVERPVSRARGRVLLRRIRRFVRVRPRVERGVD